MRTLDFRDVKVLMQREIGTLQNAVMTACDQESKVLLILGPRSTFMGK